MVINATAGITSNNIKACHDKLPNMVSHVGNGYQLHFAKGATTDFRSSLSDNVDNTRNGYMVYLTWEIPRGRFSVYHVPQLSKK
jgi:hypothetical protein